MHIPTLNGVKNGRIKSPKELLLKNVLFEPFQFLRCGIRIHTPILTEVQRGHISGEKSGHKLLKNVLFKFNFQHEGHLYAK